MKAMKVADSFGHFAMASGSPLRTSIGAIFQEAGSDSVLVLVDGCTKSKVWFRNMSAMIGGRKQVSLMKQRLANSRLTLK